jgi:ATP-dependent RNA helicase DHX37/DHR1
MRARGDAGLGPLKLVIMSATMAADEIAANARLFPAGPPPVVTVEARQHPVTVHFSRTTELEDYVGQVRRRHGIRIQQVLWCPCARR